MARLRLAAALLVAGWLSAPASAATIVEWTTASGGNGHFYQHVAGPVTWGTARTAAIASTFNGMNGYLATVTSAQEDAFLKTLSGIDNWIGGTDSDDFSVEGTWVWADGPEAGLIFWQNGPIAGVYENFNDGEPNNFQNQNEDFVVTGFNQPGGWNDLSAVTVQSGYFIEYSAAGLGAIPEPEAWAMMIAGFALVGGAMRLARKRRTDFIAA